MTPRAAPQATELPMFPLGGVLLPGMALPLRIFEHRYRTMQDAVLAADEPVFGSVLIERGSEVGGGDSRTDVGCVATIDRLERQPDGQATLLAVGTRRIRVEEWLPDAPYPAALVTDWPDRLTGYEPQPEDLQRSRDGIAGLLPMALEIIGLAHRLGSPAHFDPAQLSDDSVLASYQLATATPLGALDRLKVLRAEDLTVRLGLMHEMFEDQRVMLRAELDSGPPRQP